MKFRHVHITGASGSGASTLGKSLAARTGATHLDTDDFYWLWPPQAEVYTVKRDVPERLRLMREAFDANAERGWILSGSVGDWADPIVPLFDLVVFLRTPTDIRVARLWEREKVKFGAAIEPGGARREDVEAFAAWAADYDSGTREGRSLPRHEAWLAKLSCPVLRLDGSQPIEALIRKVLK
ncbi:MAG TPA: AAA family ATPase [Rhizomicrobium sp.]|jgi:adenylate kinase family enzyme|nr:AAA family ATPase [Rhizomicrobium sp.]